MAAEQLPASEIKIDPSTSQQQSSSPNDKQPKSWCWRNWRHHAKTVDAQDLAEGAEMMESHKHWWGRHWQGRDWKDIPGMPEFTIKEGESMREARKRWRSEFRNSEVYKQWAETRHAYHCQWFKDNREQLKVAPFKPWHGWDYKRSEF